MPHDPWSFRPSSDDRPGIWERTDVDEYEVKEPPRGEWRKGERGRDAKGRFRTGPMGMMDESDVAAYSAGSDIAALFDAEATGNTADLSPLARQERAAEADAYAAGLPRVPWRIG